MNKRTVLPLCLGCVLAGTNSHAIDLKQSKLTQVVNDVQIISAASQKQSAAAVNDVFSMPDILRTGAASRAELVAQDETITRVGANTIFSFDPANRTIDLKQGSLLFHTPHGKGGGSIHTGSATASVLGTTIIVVATPNGGFKVLALEGVVEVKFLNGLKQKLDPGQMTFVLPGANQLAPVIIFRLDELTQNSLLVGGFQQKLDSLPLIQDQITRQAKLISSGKLSDTGLYAGDNAGPNQVEVLDLNTIPHAAVSKEDNGGGSPPPPPSPPPIVPNLAKAMAADATINQPSLLDASIPTPPIHVFTGQPFSLPGNNFFGNNQFAGFVARNIFVNTPDAALDPLIINLGTYGGLPSFDFVAVNDFSLEGSTTFKGLSSTAKLSLIAGDQFLFTPGITLQADVDNFLLASPASMSFDNVSLLNAVKDININSAGDVAFSDNSLVNTAGRFIISAGGYITWTDSHIVGDSALFTALDGGISLDNTVVDAAGHVTFIAPSGISLNNSTINSDFVTLNDSGATSITVNNTAINASSSILATSAGNINITGDSETPAIEAKPRAVSGSSLITDPDIGAVVLSSSFGSVNVSGTTISAHYLTLNSGDGILLDSSGHSITASGEGATANFTAPNLVSINNADLTGFGIVNMAANTINLYNVAFGGNSQVTLASLNGVLAPNPNSSAASVPGDVNFIYGVTYGGNPAQNYVGSGITIKSLH